MGPPGSGKGTQAELLKDDLDLDHISTGELFRDEIDKGSDLGLKAKSYIESGSYVPDDLTISLLLNRLSSVTKKGVILDGFPRTLEQAKFLDSALSKSGESISAVIYYKLADSIDIARIKHRALDDLHSGKSPRADDLDEKIISQRLDVYHEKTEPILDYYRSRDLVFEVDADKSISDILSETESFL